MLPHRTRSGMHDIFRPGNVREFVVIGAATLAVFLLSSHYELYEAFYEFSRSHNDWGLDEMVITLAALSIFLAIFGWRRVRELKRAQQSVVKSERRFRALIENSYDGLALLDVDGIVTYVSPSNTRIVGGSPEASVGGSFLDRVHPDDGSHVTSLWATLKQAPGTQATAEFRYCHLDGTWLWLAATGTNLIAEPAVGAIVANFRDITKRRQAEAAQAASERRFRALIENAPDGVTLVNAGGRFEYISPSTERILGYRPDDLPDHTPLALAHRDDRPALMRVLRTLRQAPGQTATVQYRFRHRDGRWRWLEATVSNLLAQPGVNAMVFNYRDITERREADEAVRASELRLRALFEASPIALWEEDQSLVKQRLDALSAEGVTDFGAYFASHPRAIAELAGLTKVLDVNQRTLTQYHAHSKEQLLTQLALVSVAESDRAFQEELIHIAHGERQFDLETVGRTLDGELIHLSLNWAAVPGHEQDLARVIVSTIDVTKQRQAEAQLHKRLKELAAINRISTVLRETKTVSAMLPLLLQETVSVLGGSAGSVWRVTPDGNELHQVCEIGWGQAVARYRLREGIPGYVMTTGEPYIARELKSDDRVPADRRALMPAGRGGVCVPLRTDAQAIGVLYVNRELPEVFTPADAHLLTTLAEIAGSAIQRAELFEQTQRRLQRLDALRAIDMAITGSMDVVFTLHMLLAQVTEQLGVDAAAVLRLEPETQTLTYAAGQGLRTGGLKRTDMQVGQGIAGKAALERRPIEILDLPAAGAEFARTQLISGEGFVYYVVTPLVARGNVIGLLECFHRSALAPDGEWHNFLTALGGQAAVAIDNSTLFDNLRRSNDDLTSAYDATLEGWSRALDLRDKETEGHSQRVTALTLRLADALGIRADEQVHIRRGALLHDIGKMGIPDAILLKPGPLTDEDWNVMRRHPVYAYELLSPVAYLRPALDIPYCHHEKWDGTGYPRGLKGMQIPVSARAFAIVDVWDALKSNRLYRAAWPADKVRAHIQALSGAHFDPAIVDVFLQLECCTAST